MKTIFSTFLLCMIFSGSLLSQNLQPAYLGEQMPNFKLKTYQGKELSIKDLEGKKAMIVFLRGKVMDNVWCGLCMYQHAELAELELKEKIREKHNMEIVIVTQFDKDSADKWVKGFPERLNRIEQWKHPEDTVNLAPAMRDWMNFCRKHYPQKFEYTEDNVPLPFPIMLDSDKKVAKGLGIYRYEWDGTKTDQNIPTIFILDEQGTVQFKFHSQATQDRPDAEYLVEIIEKLF